MLSLLFEKAADKGFLPSYNFVGRRGEERCVTHFLFANNTLVFCRNLKEQMTFLNQILAWFEPLSGLKINLEKVPICLQEQWRMWISWLVN